MNPIFELDSQVCIDLREFAGSFNYTKGLAIYLKSGGKMEVSYPESRTGNVRDHERLVEAVQAYWLFTQGADTLLAAAETLAKLSAAEKLAKEKE